MKQKKLIFNFFVNRNWKKITDSRKRAKILANTPLRPSYPGAIHRETNCAIQWIVIYPVDSVIHLLYNWGQNFFYLKRQKFLPLL